MLKDLIVESAKQFEELANEYIPYEGTSEIKAFLSSQISSAFALGEKFERERATKELADAIEMSKAGWIEEEQDRVCRIVEGMKIKKPKCYCREYSFGEHNCGFTSNDAISDVPAKIKNS